MSIHFDQCLFLNYKHSSNKKNAELNSTGAPETHISVDLPIAKTTVSSRGWIEFVLIFHGRNRLQANMDNA
jgi:hypothetical protein